MCIWYDMECDSMMPLLVLCLWCSHDDVNTRKLLELWCPVMGYRGAYRGGTSPSRDRLPNVNDANVNWFVLFTLVQTWGISDPSINEYGHKIRWLEVYDENVYELFYGIVVQLLVTHQTLSDVLCIAMYFRC